MADSQVIPKTIGEKRVEYHFFEYPETVVLYYVLAGEVTVRNYRGTKRYQVDNYFAVNVNEPFMFSSCSKEHRLLEIKFSKDYVKELKGQGSFFELMCFANASQWAEREEEFIQDIHEFIAELKQGYCFDEVLLRRLIYFYDVTNYDYFGKKLSKKVRERHRKIVDYIKDYTVRDVSLTSIAETIDGSMYHISHDIKDRLGLTFQEMKYLIATRHAMKSLAETQESVMSISQQSGFSDPKYFVKYMKKYYGYTPSQYRRELLVFQEKKIFMNHEVYSAISMSK